MRCIAVLAIAAAGCASPIISTGGARHSQSVYITDGTGRTMSVTTTVRNSVDEATFPVAAAEVWAVLPAVYDSLGISVTELNTGARSIGNSGVKLRRQLAGTRLSRYFDCGITQGSNNADIYEVHMSLLTQAHEWGPDATRLTMAVRAQAKPMSVSGEWVSCSVTGALQSRIVALIEAQVS